jgi:peptidoglycan/xylan/chitin deacetylase (PgdA/CDA1 family)
MKKYFLLGLLCFQLLSLHAQNNTPWRGKKCAVVITYDDAINQHLDNAIPVLDSLGLKATFYITGYSPAFRDRLNGWKKIAANGHELGNHTLFHPCIGNLPGRQWVKPDYDLSKYTVQRIVDETRVNNELLQAVDGKTRRTFAYPCADTKIGDSSYIDPLKNDFAAVRNVRAEMHRIDQVDLNNVDCYMVSGQTGAQLIEWVKKATATQSLLVILFHGVGGGNSLDVSLQAHREVLQYIRQNERDIWVAPMVEVADYIKNFQKPKSVQ